ncbi:MAG TPA: c-type cytochrome [Burkholderiales bacterium]|nr:c-type cytochrome [Burkholderiales bacterium]
MKNLFGRMRGGACVAAALFLGCVAPATAQTAQERLKTCLACHGENGQSNTPLTPSLGAQPAFFLNIQMFMFREKIRAVPLMNQMMMGVSNNDIKALAEAINKLPPPTPAAGAPNAARMDAARTLAEQNRCNICHGSNYAGGENVPRIAGQREDYLAKTLREYKSNTRRGYDAAMADVLHSVSDEQIGDLAYFLSRLR